MAVSVVYTIFKHGKLNIHDVVVHDNPHMIWGQNKDSTVSAGSFREMVERKYPPEEYSIEVQVLSHVGKN